ncbi:DoxX family protein [Streptomyces sp. NBC_01190]|uniref:DoxX family protein n=1 Tax=Streptomyces sp. NBC_01190 TaxID=2903767 RepID=UPI0038640CCB|nr:DoxX family protein [Streptomyces sp. NBC_01190]
MGVAEIVLASAVGVLFVVTGGVKVVGVKQSLALRDHFAMGAGAWRLVGALETAGGAGVLLGIAVHALGVAALCGLALLMVGAITSRVRVRDPALLLAGDVVVLALVVATGVLLLAD